MAKTSDFESENGGSNPPEAATLAAAAPALYAALAWLVEHISNNDDNGHWSCWDDARDALKQARGEN